MPNSAAMSTIRWLGPGSKRICRSTRNFTANGAPRQGVAYQTLALVGAVGGAGTTRTAVEFGATLARDGRDVAILDAAFATQGLADYLAGRIETDITRVVADDADLEAALTPVVSDLPGTLVAAPARAPFERVARAKTAGAAERLERQIAARGRPRGRSRPPKAAAPPPRGPLPAPRGRDPLPQPLDARLALGHRPSGARRVRDPVRPRLREGGPQGPNLVVDVRRPAQRAGGGSQRRPRPERHPGVAAADAVVEGSGR
jgi:hypothetical protein